MKIKLSKFKKDKPIIIVKEGEREKWKYFHEYHYMTANKTAKESLPHSCKFFTFYWLKDEKEILIGCIGVLNQISVHPSRRFTRLVILPEFQGLGFSTIMMNNIAEIYKKKNINMYIATFHPRLGSYFERSSLWIASNNNMREFRKTEIAEGTLKDTIRDGQCMYRYKYGGMCDYEMIYNPIDLSELETQLRSLTKDSKERKECVAKIKHIKRIKKEHFIDVLPETLSKDAVWHLEAKGDVKRLFKRNKRKPLTREERAIAKAKLKEKKEK